MHNKVRKLRLSFQVIAEVILNNLKKIKKKVRYTKNRRLLTKITSVFSLSSTAISKAVKTALDSNKSESEEFETNIIVEESKELSNSSKNSKKKNINSGISNAEQNDNTRQTTTMLDPGNLIILSVSKILILNLEMIKCKPLPSSFQGTPNKGEF